MQSEILISKLISFNYIYSQCLHLSKIYILIIWYLEQNNKYVTISNKYRGNRRYGTYE